MSSREEAPMINMDFWRKAREQEQQGHGVRMVGSVEQLPPGAKIEYPEGPPAKPALPLDPEQAARMAMEG